MKGPTTPTPASIDRSLLPVFAWTNRWRDPVASHAMLRQLESETAKTQTEMHALTLVGLAWHQRKNGDFELARTNAEAAVQTFQHRDPSPRTGCALMIAAAACMDLGDLKRSHESLTRSLLQDHREETDNGPSEFHALRARLHWYSGEHQQAVEQMKAALRVARDEQLAGAHHDHAIMCMLQDDLDGLRDHISEAASIAQDLDMTALLPTILAVRARASCLFKEFGAAWADLNEARALADAADNRRAICLILTHGGECHAKAGRLNAATEMTREALTLARQLNYRSIAPIIARQLGDCLTATGAHEAAAAAFRDANDLRIS